MPISMDNIGSSMNTVTNQLQTKKGNGYDAEYNQKVQSIFSRVFMDDMNQAGLSKEDKDKMFGIASYYDQGFGGGGENNFLIDANELEEMATHADWFMDPNNKDKGGLKETSEPLKAFFVKFFNDMGSALSNIDKPSSSTPEEKEPNLFGLGEKSVQFGNATEQPESEGTKWFKVDTESIMNSAHQFNEELKAKHGGKLTMQDIAKDMFGGDIGAAKLACGADGDANNLSDLDLAAVLSMADSLISKSGAPDYSRRDGKIDTDEWQATQKLMSERGLDDSNKGILGQVASQIKAVLANKTYNNAFTPVT